MSDRTIKFFGYSVIFLIMLCPFLLFYYSYPLIKATSVFKIFFSSWDPDSNKYGLSAFIATSFIVGFLASMISFVLSLGIAIHIYISKSKILKSVITFMTGIPTVVYAFLGLLFIVPVIRKYTVSPTGLSLLAVIVVLSVIILPTIVLYILETFNMVSKDVRETALALGATEEQFVRKILIPTSVKGIFTAYILGFGRGISDTIVGLLISGNAIGFPHSIFESARSLTSHIALLMPGEFDSIEFKAIFFSGLIFIFIIFILNILIRRFEK